MNLTDRQRKLLFVGIVVLLAAIGIYLTLMAPDGGSDDKAGPRTSPTAVPSVSSGPTGPASPPPGISSTIDPKTFDVYKLLPFTQQEFATAADLAQRFIAANGTYRFDEDPKVFVGRLSGLVTDQLLGELQRSASAPGMLEQRRQEQTTATCSAGLDRVRDIEDNSIIFLVTGHQQVTKSGKQSTDSQQWAVTVARDGGSLKVYSFEPAGVGQQGDTG
jgi:hypothetical protein